MANRFQTPIDNQFIDTYVPIPFQELMNAAQIKQGRWDEAAGSLAEAESAAQLVRAIEGTPDAAYRDEVVNYMKDRAAYYTSGKLDLSDPLVQNQINADIRKVDQVRLQSIGDSRSNWDAERVKEAELRQKGEWNDRLYEPKWGEWDSRRGIYTGNAEAEIKTSTELEPYFKDMETEFKDIVGNDPNSLAMYARNEVGRNRIREHARNIANQMKDTTWADQQLRLKYGSGYKDKISTAEQQAYIEEAINNYAVELWPQSDIQPMSKQGSPGGFGTLRDPANIPFDRGSENSVLTQQYDSRNANQVVRQVNKDVESLERTLAADASLRSSRPGHGMSEEDLKFVEGKRNMLIAHQTGATTAANQAIGDAPTELYKNTLQELTAMGVDPTTAEKMMANVVGSGLGTLGDKLSTNIVGFTDKVTKGARGLGKMIDSAALHIASFIPGAYYNVTDGDPTIKDKIAEELEYMIETAGGDVTHSATLGDYIEEYFNSVGEKVDARTFEGSTKSGPLSIINNYRKEMKEYSSRYEDIYAETLHSGLQYTVSGRDLTLPTYSKIPNSNGYEITGTGGESRVAKWWNNLPSYKNSVVITATNSNGKPVKEKDASRDMVDLKWEDVSEQTISTSPEFDENGAPYLTINLSTGTGKNKTRYKVRVMYNNPAIESIKEDLLIQARGARDSKAPIEAYLSLGDTEIPSKIRSDANVGNGANFKFYSMDGAEYDVAVKLNPNTGRYMVTSQTLTAGGKPLHEDGLTIEEAEARAKELQFYLLGQASE